MNYQSPIDVIMGQMKISYENEIFKAVQKVGINVDKNELLKALQYDRGQYQKGYADRDSEIVRCKDCKRAKLIMWGDHEEYKCYPPIIEDMPEALIDPSDTPWHEGDFYCAYGIRKED